MKILSTLLSAIVVVGFAGAASAQCASYGKSTAQQTASAPYIAPEAGAGS